MPTVSTPSPPAGDMSVPAGGMSVDGSVAAGGTRSGEPAMSSSLPSQPARPATSSAAQSVVTFILFMGFLSRGDARSRAAERHS